MGIEDSSRIDMKMKRDDGGYDLIIMDSGMETNSEHRLRLFRNKLMGYAQYIQNGNLALSSPDDASRVRIRVITPLAPSEEMRGLSLSTQIGGDTFPIPIEFEIVK